MPPAARLLQAAILTTDMVGCLCGDSTGSSNSSANSISRSSCSSSSSSTVVCGTAKCENDAKCEKQR